MLSYGKRKQEIITFPYELQRSSCTLFHFSFISLNFKNFYLYSVVILTSVNRHHSYLVSVFPIQVISVVNCGVFFVIFHDTISGCGKCEEAPSYVCIINLEIQDQSYMAIFFFFVLFFSSFMSS